VCVLALASICGSCVRRAPATQPEQLFDLAITLQDVYNPDLSVVTILRMDEPFFVRITKGTLITTFWGELHGPREEKYPLSLSIREWESPTSNRTDGMRYDLRLGESRSGGSVSSFVYRRTVMLMKHEAQP
jgi:hypothetical protein